MDVTTQGTNVGAYSGMRSERGDDKEQNPERGHG